MVDCTANAPLFDYTRLLESTDDWRHMFGLVIQESEKDLTELETALKIPIVKPCAGLYTG